MRVTNWAAGFAVVSIAAMALCLPAAAEGRHSSSSGRDVQVAQQKKEPAKPATQPAPAAAAPVPQPVPERFEKWATVCFQDAQGKLYCRAEQIVVNEARRPELAIIVRPPRQDGQLPVASITPPWGIQLARGIDLQIDTAPPVRAPIRTCLPSGCIADFSVVEALQNQLQKGTTLKVTMAAANGQPLSISVPLAGFAQAYNRAIEKQKK